MNKFKISAIALLALIGVAYVSSSLTNETVPAVNRSQDACDPNYSDCVPIATDVDCAGGDGNGPEYVQGPVRVLGTDIYQLDRDRDGIACE